MGKPVIATSTKSKLGATASMNWFLDSQESSPVAATFRPLINGKEAFTTLHEKIEKAEPVSYTHLTLPTSDLV